MISSVRRHPYLVFITKERAYPRADGGLFFLDCVVIVCRLECDVFGCEYWCRVRSCGMAFLAMSEIFARSA